MKMYSRSANAVLFLRQFLGFSDLDNEKVLFLTIFRGAQPPCSITQRGLEPPSPHVVDAYGRKASLCTYSMILCQFFELMVDFPFYSSVSYGLGMGGTRTSNFVGGGCTLSVNFLPEFPIVLSENLPK